MRRVTLEDGTVVRAGTVEEAAAIAKVKPRTYRLYERLDRTPLRGRPAPGPFKVRDPDTGSMILARDPATGRPLRNLDAVTAWMAERVPGRRPDRDTPSLIRRTEWRQMLLEAAESGRLGVVDPLELDLPGQDDTKSRRVARITQAIVELASIGLLSREGNDGSYKLTDDGVAVLQRFRDEVAN